MTFSSHKSLNYLCIAGYLIFMTLAFDSTMVDALVFYVSEQNGSVVLKSGKVQVKPVSTRNGTTSKLVAVQYQQEPKTQLGSETISRIPTDSLILEQADASQTHLAMIDNPKNPSVFTAPLPDDKASSSDEDEDESSEMEEDEKNDSPTGPKNLPTMENATLSPDPGKPIPPKNQATEAAFNKLTETSRAISSSSFALLKSLKEDIQAKSGDAPKTISIISLIKSLPEKRWEYDPNLDRYIVRYDSKTTLVLTLRPALQRLIEKIFEIYRCKLGAAIIQDPTSGAILAMTSYDGHRALEPIDPQYTENNWALKATFPVASIFKIITASAGIERGKVVPTSRIRFGKKAELELWRAFAKSHNGVFGIVGRAVGQRVLQWYANAFGFNKPFYFDLPVSASVADLPDTALKLGQASAGLDKHFEVSPMHVASIVSTILNRGRWMKPYLVDYVMYDGKVIFRRKPFQLAQPISTSVATQIYEMMRTTTTHGTGKRGFAGYSDFPSLATLCGGKTGTLTGMNPNLLFTWFGGFTHTAGRDLGIVVLVGQGSHCKATTIAGRISYELLAARTQQTERLSQK